MKKILLMLAMLGTITCTMATKAESPADLLEQGAYQEDAVGDLNAALAIYNKLIQTHRANKQLVSQALYRKGLCYQKLGDIDKARSAFENIINEFSQQKDIVKLANIALKEYSKAGLKFLPVPWSDGELLKYSITAPTGGKLGMMEVETREIVSNQQKQWHIDTYLTVLISNMFQFSRVSADSDSFNTVNSYVNNSLAGTYSANYSFENIAAEQIEPEGKTTKNTLKIDQLVYDYEQLPHIIRRLPLSDKYFKAIKLYFSPRNIMPIAEISVLEEEKVTVPAGIYDTYKVKVAFKSPENILPTLILWVVKDMQRQIVRYEFQGSIAELQEASNVAKRQLKTIADENVGISFKVPEQWRSIDARDVDKNLSAFHHFFAPKMDALGMLAVREFEAANVNTSLYSIVDGDINALKSYFKRYKIRPDSTVDSIINGAPARSYIADYKFKQQDMVEYRSYILGPKGVYWFVLRVKPTAFEKHRAAFESLVASLVTPNDKNKTCVGNQMGKNLLTNGDFSQARKHWVRFVHDSLPEAEVKFNKKRGWVYVQLRDSGTEDWFVQLAQEYLCIEYAKTYRLSFDYALLTGKPDVEFKVTVQKRDGSYTNYMAPQTLTPASEKQTFSMDFIMSSPTDNSGRVLFNMGGQKVNAKSPSQFYIDNVSLIQL